MARAVRHAPDRVAHPWRRERARARLARGAPHSLLVLCLGNICRSPYTERRLRSLLPGREVRSAGLLEGGRPSPPLAVEVAGSRDIDLGRHVSVRLSDETLGRADLVLVMNGSQAREARRRSHHLGVSPLVEWLGDFDPGALERRALRDPFDREREVFEEVYARIDACCGVIADALDVSG